MQSRKPTTSKGSITICVASRSKRGDSTLLFCPGKIPPAVLSLSLGSPTQKEHGPVRPAPEDGQEDVQRAGGHLLRRQAKRGVIACPGEEKAPRYHFGTFQYLKQSYKKAGERLSTKACCNRTRINVFKQ